MNNNKVKIIVYENSNKFISYLIYHSIYYEDLTLNDNYTLTVDYEDYKTISRRYKTKIIKYHGKRFITNYIKYNKYMLVSLFISFLVLKLLTSTIFKININTNDEKLYNLIYNSLKDNDIDLYKKKKSFNELNNLISQAIEDEGVKDDISDKMDFCEEIKLISNKIYDELAVNIYQTLSKVVTDEYNTIHWKPDYKKIIVDQDFKVLVEKSRGNIVSATDPSTGSRNVLALTFMAALNSLSGFVLPQIIDTPIASLDLEMRSEVAKALPRYMEGKQMILLVMNSEYAGEFKTNIKKFVGYQYILDYVGSEGEGQTIIKEFD